MSDSTGTPARVARIRVTGELLRQILHFPAGTLFLDARRADRWGDLEILVEHPDLRPVPESSPIPEVTPTWEEVYPLYPDEPPAVVF